MAWDDHDCACGGYKDCETLFCKDCMEALAAGIEDLATFLDIEAGYERRRSAAMRLLNLARNRKHCMKPITSASEDLATYFDIEAGYERRRPAERRLLNQQRKRKAVVRRAQEEGVTALIRKLIIEPQERFYAEERRREGR